MLHKPEGCNSCPLKVLGKGFVPAPSLPSDWAGIRLLIQGEAPGVNEIDEGKAFVGKAGHWLRHNWLANAGLGAEECLFDNTLRCLPPLNKASEHYPVGEERSGAERTCLQYEVWSRCPRRFPLLLVGAKALNQQLKLNGVSDWHGHIAMADGRIVGCTFHPAAVMRQPNLLPVVIRETANLLVAAQDPARYMRRPTVQKGMWLKPNGKDMVIDLEWSTDTRKIACVGMAASGDEAVSSYFVEPALDAIKRHDGRLIGHNVIDADFAVMGWEPKSWRPEHVIDTKILAHLVHAHLAELGLLGLGDLVRMYRPTPDWKQDKTDLLEYNGLDCAYNFRLWDDLRADIDALDCWALVEKQQTLAYMARLMRERGIRIDTDGIRQYHTDWSSKRTEIAKRFPFNPNAPVQTVAWLREHGYPVDNARYETLETLKGRHPVIEALLEYKDEGKSLKVWYPDKCLDEGRIHPSFNVTGTAVARFSCADPNCQNIPPHLRRFIVAEDDSMEIVAFDFSQIENRCVAWCAGDERMLADFRSGMDFHRLSASRIFNVRYDDVTQEQRYEGKKTIHATNYGESAYHLAERLFGNRKGDSVSRARWLQAAYFGVYPRISEWQHTVSMGLDRGDILLRNAFGRPRFIYARDSHERMKRGCHYHGCSNAADIVNGRMIDVWRELGLLPILIVHDELVYLLPKQSIRVRQQIKDVLERPVPEMDGLVVPVTMKAGANYGELH